MAAVAANRLSDCICECQRPVAVGTNRLSDDPSH